MSEIWQLFTPRQGQCHAGCWRGEGQVPEDEAERRLPTGYDATRLFVLVYVSPAELRADNSKGVKGLVNCN